MYNSDPLEIRVPLGRCCLLPRCLGLFVPGMPGDIESSPPLQQNGPTLQLHPSPSLLAATGCSRRAESAERLTGGHGTSSPVQSACQSAPP